VPGQAVELLRGGLGHEPALEAALSAVLLRVVASGKREPVLRCYHPPRTVAFGRRERFYRGSLPRAGPPASMGSLR